MPLFLSNSDVERVLDMATCMEVLDEAYKEAGHGRAIDAPVLRILTPRSKEEVPGATEPIYHGYSCCPAAISKWNVACDRVDSDFIHYPYINGVQRQVRLPGSPSNRFCGLITLYSSLTGEPLAVIHDGYLQKFRVGATSGLGTKYLAKRKAKVLGLIGSGWQASAAIEAHCLVRPFELVKVYSPTQANREEFARTWSEKLQLEVKAVDSAEEAVRGSDVVNANTNSLESVMRTEWIEPGMYIVPVKDFNELELTTLERADRLVSTTPWPQWAYYGIGGLEGFPEHGKQYWGHVPTIDWEGIPLLGEVIAGKKEGRSDEEQVTILLNKGHGLQFAAVGYRVYRLAKEKGLGTEIDTGLYLQGKEYIP
jgi:alanine dehydrogenase